MIDFKDINRLLHYEWSLFFINCEPKGNLVKFTEKEFRKLFNSSICRMIGEILKLIASLLLVSTIIELGDQTLKIVGISNKIGFTTFISLIVIIIFFIYLFLNKNKEQKTNIYIFIIAFIFVDTIGTLVKLIGFISALFINPLSALFGLLAIFFVIMGNAGIVCSLIDICERAKDEYTKNNTIMTMDNEIVMKPIDVNDVSDHTIKKCAYCGKDVSKTANYCKYCGSKL